MYFFKDTNGNWIIGESVDSIVSKVPCELRKSSPTTVAVRTVESRILLLSPIEVTALRKNAAGEFYATFTEFKAAVSDFFDNAPITAEEVDAKIGAEVDTLSDRIDTVEGIANAASGGSLGSIKPTDAAPTPARNGNYTFSIGGDKPAWLTAEAGITEVKAGDGVAVVYDGVSAYAYTHVNVSSAFVTMQKLAELGYMFKGVATPATVPGTPDGPVFYLASTPGTYANFGGLVLNGLELCLLLNSTGAWTKTRIGVSSLLQNMAVFDSYNSTYNNVDIEPQSVTLKKEGITIVYGTTYKTLTGVADYVFTRTSIRKYLYLNMEVLISNAASVLDYTTPNLLVESEDSLTNNQSHVLLCGFYANELQSGIGLLAPIINKMKTYYSAKNQYPLSYVGNAPNDVVSFSTTGNTITFPSSFAIFSNGTKYSLTSQQVIPIVCKSYPGRVETASSLGFLVMNTETKEILNVHHNDYVNLENKWTVFGVVKRNTSLVSPVGPIQVSGNFPYKIDGKLFGIPYIESKEIRYNINPAFYFGGASNLIIQANTTNNSITFPANFSVWGSNGQKYTIPSEQVVPLICTFYATGLPVGSSTGVLVINKSTLEIKNIYHADWTASMSDSWITFGIIKRSTSDTAVVGKIQIIGFFPYSVDGGGGAVYESRYLICPTFWFTSTANKVVEINTSDNTIFFASGFTVFGPDGVNYDIPSDQTVSIRTTSFDTGVPVMSATGVLVLNKDTREIKNIYWGDWKTKLTANYLTIGVIKRSTSSLTEVGDVQVLGFFPYSINGSGELNLLEDVVQRNVDIQPLVLGAIFPKRISGVQTTRFNFLHTSDIHSDGLTTRNFTNYLNSLTKISQAVYTGDLTAGNFSEDVTELLSIMQGSSKPVYTVIGNHDVGNSKEVALAGNNDAVYAKFIQPFETTSGMITNGKNYWYKDDATNKIRIIALYEYDDPNDLDADPAYYKIQRGMRVLSQAQIDWFIDLLENTPSNYHVIIWMHQNPTTVGSNMVLNPDWTPESTVSWNPQNLILGNPINDIIDAWMTGGSINQSYSFTGDAAYLSAISAVADFSTRGTGDFIGYFFGHHHNDGAGTFSNYPNQNWVAITCGTVDQNQSQFDDLPRITGTKTEDAFNLVSVDTANKKIYVVRIGSNINKSLVDRKFVILNY